MRVNNFLKVIILYSKYEVGYQDRLIIDSKN